MLRDTKVFLRHGDKNYDLSAIDSTLELYTEIKLIFLKYFDVQRLWADLKNKLSITVVGKQLPTETKMVMKAEELVDKMTEIIAQEKFILRQFCQNELFKSTVDQLLVVFNYCNHRYRKFMDRKRGVYPRYQLEHEIVQVLSGTIQY